MKPGRVGLDVAVKGEEHGRARKRRARGKSRGPQRPWKRLEVVRAAGKNPLCTGRAAKGRGTPGGAGRRGSAGCWLVCWARGLAEWGVGAAEAGRSLETSLLPRS